MISSQYLFEAIFEVHFIFALIMKPLFDLENFIILEHDYLLTKFYSTNYSQYFVPLMTIILSSF